MTWLRQESDSDGGQGNRQLAQTAQGGHGLGDVLTDEGDENGEVSPFDELSDAPGMSWRRRARAFKKSGRIERWADALMGLRPRGAAVSGGEMPGVGGQRVLKSGGWKWERSQVWNPDLANRLWLAMALSYAWMVSLGAAVFSSDKAVKEVAGGRSRAARAALFRLGVDVLHLYLERGRGGVCSLLFPSGLGRAGKSVARQALYGRGLG